ncbi:hypothetical protein ACYZT8_20370 [Pseudomonas sp. LB3P93]
MAGNEEFDISESMAAELTGSLGVPDNATTDDVLPTDLASAVEGHDRHIAERDIPVNNDVDDTREAADQRDVEQDQSQQRGRKVPLAALQEERQKRQALELQLQAQAQQLQQLQAQQQAAQQAQLQAQQEAEIPSFEDDPQGYILAREKQFKQELENLKGGQVEQQQAAQFQAQLEQDRAAVLPALVETETQFMAAHPDYQQALDHVQQNVESSLRQMYPQADPTQFGVLRTAALVQFTKQCQSNGVNPCEHIYQRAQQLGFKAASRAPRKAPNTSLSDAHGSARAPDEKGSMSVSQVSEMTEAEFDKFWSQMKSDSAVKPAY